MLEEFTKAWPQIVGPLRENLKSTKQINYNSYEDLFKMVLNLINETKEYHWDMFSVKDLKVIDYGDYQGTLIFVFHKDMYQPTINKTYYTYVEYGSCSGCDTLLGICDHIHEVPTDTQVNDYVALCLHMLQHIKIFGEE